VSNFSKNHKSLIKYAAGIGFLTFLVALTTCNSPMGFGPIVDTEPPTVLISRPTDNYYVRGTLQGDPIEMEGITIDDVGVTSLRFEIFSKTEQRVVVPADVWYELEPQGNGRHSWYAEIIMPEGLLVTADYEIKVIGQDKFGNEGSAYRTVRIDIIPPWVKEARVVRHPGPGDFTAFLHDRNYFVDAGYQMPEAYRNIPYIKIDEYQNETFTLKIEIESEFADVAASRLYIKDDSDRVLNEDWRAPTRYWNLPGEREQRYPEWDISATDILAWRPSFSAGARYIYFEVWAWGEPAWAGTPEAGAPIPGEPERVQRIGGTIWYPESDAPHIYIDPKNILNDIITLSPDSSLPMEFYDDDRLGSVYTKLVTKQDFDTLRGVGTSSVLSEEDYLISLTDPLDPGGKRAALIPTMQSHPNPSNVEKRHQSVDVATGSLPLGEYRLIALAKDDKTVSGFSFTEGEKWSAYPPVMIQIQNTSAPIVIVQNPTRENLLPNLSEGGGERFIMSGRALGQIETKTVQIAWVPLALQQAGSGLADAVELLASPAVRELDPEESLIDAATGIKVWNVKLQNTVRTVINDRDYYETGFSQEFHIVDDFQYMKKQPGPPFNDRLENENKLFVIHAINDGAETHKTFNIPKYSTGPTIYNLSHTPGAGHDPHDNLDLSMSVRPGNNGVLVKDDSPIIIDVTGGPDGDESSFEGMLTTLDGGVYKRTVTSLYIMGNPEAEPPIPGHYPEGMLRQYAFRAMDILGNLAQVTREITLSNRPLLESISCSTGEGSYGIDKQLRFEAVFSLPVRVTRGTNWPRLKLYLEDPGIGKNVTNPAPVYADYDTTAPQGSTMFFTYTVKAGDTTPKLHTSLDPIDKRDAMITPTSNYNPAEIEFLDHANSLQNTTPVKLDADRPAIERASFATVSGFTNGGITYFNNGRIITLKLMTNEKVMVSGNPKAVIRFGSPSARRLDAVYASKYDAPNGGEILTFTVAASDSVNGAPVAIGSTALYWGEPWFDFKNSSGITNSAITDEVGNNIIPDGYESLSTANRYGQVSGSYSSEQGYIKTTIPATPIYTLDGTDGGPDGKAAYLKNGNVSLVVNTNGETGTTLSYSLGAVPTVYDAPVTILDTNSGSKLSTSYERSQYSVTAWQVDMAGNRSAQAPSRLVTINSRWPELRGLDLSVSDGSYSKGTAITFKMNFSGGVKALAGASVTLDLVGIGANATGTAKVTGTPYTAGDGFSTLLSVDWTVPATNTTANSISGTMKNIKATNIAFTNVQDEYVNTLGSYSGGTATESPVAGPPATSRRPIDNDHTIALYAFQLNRPNVELRLAGPRVISASPDLPTADGEFYNGKIITANNGMRFTLTFDAPITKVAGKYITVRPYGTWAIPPVLSSEDFNALLNKTTNATDKKRLTNVDDYRVPFADSIRGNTSAFNSYIENTHGVTSIPSTNGYVRPDTSAKWVLAFDIDPYQTLNVAGTASDGRTELLRAVFNAAEWKWQRIPVSNVSVSGSTVTVTLNEALQKGRIWEVLVEEGAFQDLAGNPSVGVDGTYSYNSSGPGYRFWSAGTETPVVRVDKITYDGRVSYTNPTTNARRQANINLGFINASNVQQIPPIDTKVRIDCETPGAAIRYNVIRTGFNFKAASGTAVTVGGTALNPVLGGTTGYTTNADFFGDNLKIAGTGAGYTKNTIGNDAITVTDANGFLNTLLTPNKAQTVPDITGVTANVTDALLNTNNGTFVISSMTVLQGNLRDGTNLNTDNGLSYRTVSAAGAPSQDTPGSLNYIFIGDAYDTNTNIVAAHTSQYLYSGRRDYIVAAAQKGLVNNTGTDAGKRVAGPLLDVSLDSAKPYAGMEGVYKTTFIYRDPLRGGSGAIRGIWDGRTEVLFNGVPVPGFGMDDSPPGTDRYETIAYKTFYRIGGTITGARPASGAATNNHLLVSWEIVTDVKRNRPAFYYADTDSNWAGAFTTATYGGVSYRYNQGF